MTQAKPRFLSFEEYLSYDDGTDKFYELVNGKLVELPPESGENVSIAGFLFVQFALMIGHLRVRGHGLELEVRGEPRNRYPDLAIIREEHIPQLLQRNTIRLSMAAPLLVMEVVSPGELQHDRDYVAKRQQYQDRGISEYWLVDPGLQLVTVLYLNEGHYTEVEEFHNQDQIVSIAFPELTLTAQQILTSGR